MRRNQSFGDDSGLESQSDSATLFGSTMSLVAATAGLFALGAYLGRHLSYGWGWVFFIISLAILIAMRYAVRATSSSSVALLFAFGIAMGLGTGPTVAYYASANPKIVWEASGATALFMAGLGGAGYATKRDLSALARVALVALIGLIIFGIVTIFVNIPGGEVAYSVIGLIVFAALTLVDFQRLRGAGKANTAPLLAASIFLDALNVFLFFLNLFNRRN